MSIWLRSTRLMRAGPGGREICAWGDWATTPSSPGRIELVSLMRSPFRAAGRLVAPDLEGMPIFNDPLQRLAFFQFQCRRQRCRADQIVLTVFAAPFDDLEF